MNRLFKKESLLRSAALASCVLVPPLFANSTPPGNTAGPIATSAFNGSIEVLSVSKVTGTNANAIDLDTNGGQIIIDPNNTFAGLNAVFTTGVALESIGINITGVNSKVTVGIGSGINAENTTLSSDGIFVDSAGVSIDNAGTIRSANFSAIHLSTNASNFFVGTTIHNQSSGIITNSATGTVPTLLIDNGIPIPGLLLINSGTIQSLAAQDAIQINSPFTSIINNNGGVIKQNNAGVGNALTINAGATTGNIANNPGGIISVNGTGNAIFINANTTGDLFNGGTLLGNGGSVILLGIGAILNGGITNTGIINAGAPTNVALNLQAGQTTFFQNNGAVTGDVFLPSSDPLGTGNVFFMNGGIIDGDIIAANTVANSLQFNGGSVLGTVTLGNLGDTLNLSGSNLTAIQGGLGIDTFNVTGGSFITLDGGLGNDILNINADFTANGTINNIPNINVNNAGTVFIVNQPITGMTGSIIIDPNTAMIFNTNMPAVGSGSIQNNGFLQVTSDNTITTTGSITNSDVVNIEAGAVLKSNTYTQTNAFEVEIQSTSRFGQIQTSGAANVAGTINPQLNLISFIPSGSTFDVLKATGALTDTSTLVQPNSAILYFIKTDVVCGNNCIRLTAQNRSLLSLTGSPITQGVANALDHLAQAGTINPTLNNLLTQLQLFSTQEAIEDALQSLIPPFNYGLISGSNIGMENNFTSISDRLINLHMMFHRFNRTPQGKNYGDPAGYMGAWIKPYGAHLNQNQISGIDGYKANAGGLAGGVDWGINPCSTIGIAGSFTKVKIDDKNNHPKDEIIKSWQGTLYGWFDFMQSIFMDAMVGISQNHYNINRIISVNQLNTAAQAHFTGKQYGLQADLGWYATHCLKYYLAPITRLRYLWLDLDSYTETGAGNLSLNVENHVIHQFQAGVGVRSGAAVYFANDIQWITSITGILSYDFDNDGEQTVADFLGANLAFETNGIQPKPVIYDLGLEISRNANHQSTLTLKYDLQLREDFLRNAVYLEYYLLW